MSDISMLSAHSDRNGRARASLVVGTLALLGTSFMLITKLNDFSMWFDEINMTTRALAFDPLDSAIYKSPGGHPPLYFALLKAWTLVAGEQDLALRAFSIFAAVVSAAFVYRIAADLAGQSFAGVAASLLFGAMGFVRYYVHQTHNYALLLMIAMALLFFYQRWWERPTARLYAVGVVISTTAIIYTHYFGIFVILALNLHVLLAYQRRIKDAFKWVGLQVVAAVLYIPWFIALLSTSLVVSVGQSGEAVSASQTGLRLQVSSGDAFSLGSRYSDVSYAVKILLSEQTMFYGVLLGIGLIGLLVFKHASIRRYLNLSSPLILTAIFLIGSLGFVLLVNTRIRGFLPRRVIFLLPAFAILIAYLLSHLPRKLGWPVLAVGVVFTFTASWSGALPGNWRFRQALELIESQREPNDLVFVQAGGNEFAERPFRYYAGRVLDGDVPFLTFSDFGNITIQSDFNKRAFADDLFADYIWTRDRFWVIHPSSNQYGVPEVDWIEQIDGKQFVEIDTLQYGWMTISLFADMGEALALAPPSALLPNEPLLLPQSLGGTFELVDYRLNRLVAQPGDEITVWLDWKATQNPDENYAVYVHLLEGEKILWGQVDGDPSHVGRAIATELWATDTIIHDAHTFRVQTDAPAGQYQLKIGMYSREDGQRLPVAMGNGTITDGLVLATIEVR